MKLLLRYGDSNDTWGLRANTHGFYPFRADVNNRGANWGMYPSSFWNVDADLLVYLTSLGRGGRDFDTEIGRTTGLVLKLSSACQGLVSHWSSLSFAYESVRSGGPSLINFETCPKTVTIHVGFKSAFLHHISFPSVVAAGRSEGQHVQSRCKAWRTLLGVVIVTASDTTIMAAVSHPLALSSVPQPVL
ncbi:hypothetical protein ARMGADRAFT_1091252 [Armillaria gallica]|uniref:Uncharacterized protein n=1 Tax=Armillaria gallica TaxID=47427 RepID=A0A2H3CQK6_ARMGA|nr:hypothetical protein ARMGADRAFT_1091252 [Armillaria gallica]